MLRVARKHKDIHFLPAHYYGKARSFYLTVS